MNSKGYEAIIYEKVPPIAYITLNRPDRLNAISAQLQSEVREALEDSGWVDDEIRVIVIKGAGRAFCSGFDISGEASRTAIQRLMSSQAKRTFTDHTFWNVFWNNPKPLIAQVHSFCLAGGMGIAAFCDLCICSEDALFGAPETRYNEPFLPAIWPWHVGMRKARELHYTGNLIDAQEAWRIGFVNKVVPREKLDEETSKFAHTIAKVPAVSVQYNKKLINMAYELMNIQQVFKRSNEVTACISSSSESLPEVMKFNEIREENGLKAALDMNKTRFAEEDAWWRARRKK